MARKELTGFHVIAPSMVGRGESFSVRIRALGPARRAPWACYQARPATPGPFNRSPRGIWYLDNTAPDWHGRVVLHHPGVDGPDGADFADPGPRPILAVSGFRCDRPGIVRVSVEDPLSGTRNVSNPITVADGAPGERLYWGDLHCHTFFSDGLRCPEELCAFARDEAFLDFFALADHAEWITNAQWRYFMDVINRCNRPETFVTLLGFEWTSMRFGHRNLYFPGERAPILRSQGADAVDLDGLYRAARNEGALVVPHHSANVEMGVNWELGHDPDVERLCEVYSIWGNSERSAAEGNPRPIRAHGGEQPGRHVLDALRSGRRYGLIASGDIHDGRPGAELHTLQEDVRHYKLLWPQGLVGVWAPRLTREAVFEALWNRRVYGTTGVRLLLRFTVNGAPMGSVLRGEGSRRLMVEVVAPEPVEDVTIVRNGADWQTFDPGTGACRVEAGDSGGAPGWYYVRVTCSDGNMAWSSPVWFTA